MPKSSKTFYEAGREFLYWCQYGRQKPIAKTTLHTYSLTLDRISKHFGDVPVEDITYEHITNLKKDFIDGGAQMGYLNKVVTEVRSIIKFAEERMGLRVIAWQKIEIPAKPKPDPQYLSPSEMERAMACIKLDTIQGIRFKAVFTAMLDTGMRISEVLSINRDTIDWGDKSAFIIGKGSKKRKVLFQDWSLWWIKQYLENRKDNHEAVFVSHQNGYPMARLRPDDVQRVFRRIAQQTGIEKFTPHIARKTAANTMWGNGADIQDIQIFLGHEKLQTTQIYVGKNYDRVREVQSRTLQYRTAVDIGQVAVIRWAKGHDQCIQCSKTDKPHGAKGYCINCYMNLKNARVRAEKAQTVQNPVQIST